MKAKEQNDKFGRNLSGKQENVLSDMFLGDKTLQEILKTRRVSLGTYLEWQTEPAYIDAFDKWILSSKLMLAATLAAYSQHAIASLVNLTGNEKTETARKACLDIIHLVEKEQKDETELPIKSSKRLLVASATTSQAQNISTEKQSALLTALASEES